MIQRREIRRAVGDRKWPRIVLAACAITALSACDGRWLLGQGTGGPVDKPGLNDTSPRLNNTSPLQGVVVDGSGSPVAGVSIKLFRADANPLTDIAPFTGLLGNTGAALIGNSGAGLIGNSGAGLAAGSGAAYRRQILAITTTGENGAFALDVPEDGVYNLEAVKNDDFKAFKKALEVKKASATEVGPVTLQPTGTLTGKVTAPHDPLVQDFEGADVFVPGTDYVAKASRTGTYTILNVAAGSFDVAARYGSVGKAKVRDVMVRPKETIVVPDLALEVAPPAIRQVFPPHAGPGATVFLIGDNFGAVAGEPIEVTFGGIRLETVERLGAGGLEVRLPGSAKNANFQLRVQGIPSAPFPFKVLESIRIVAHDEALRLGETRHYKAVATDTAGAEVPDPVHFWLPEGGTITVSATGDVKGQALGMSTLYAFSGEVGAALHINVVERYPEVSTLAGNGQPGATDGPVEQARFAGPTGLAVDRTGRVYVADTGNDRIRRIEPDGTVATVAGGPAGDADGNAQAARMAGPRRVAVAPGGEVYVADTGNRKIRKIAADGTVSTLAQGRDFVAVAVDTAGVLYAIDGGRNEVVRLGPDGSLAVLADETKFRVRNYPEAPPKTSTPRGLAVGPSGNLYLADPHASRIWKLAGGAASVLPSVLAGSYDAGRALDFGLVDAPATASMFSGPLDLAVDAAENVYVADTMNHRIRKIAPGGLVTTIAGSGGTERGNGGYADREGPAARFDEPAGIAADTAGNIYVTDSGHRVRKIVP